ncbi:ribosomal RNA small subunit methyltransferase A [Candidatus Saccharibacteria bacterium]|nr:ribosomal RNA small subunit methyltransferase A [Candidatus Saccharibacteria bacterium]
MVDKSLGQHWLKNREILDEIADLAASEASHALCLEIGPGLGTLTSSLLKRFSKVLSVEFDPKLAANLPKSFPGKNLEVINEDILKFDFSSISEPYTVVGNIPYYITSPIIEKVLTQPNLPEKVVLLMQKEVAERVCDKKESVLSLFVKNRAIPALGPVVLKEEFEPAPKVDSQVLILEPFKNGPKYEEKLFSLIKIAFRAPRKKLVHNLASLKPKTELLRIFDELGIDQNARPADLNLDTYHALFCAIM